MFSRQPPLIRLCVVPMLLEGAWVMTATGHVIARIPTRSPWRRTQLTIIAVQHTRLSAFSNA